MATSIESLVRGHRPSGGGSSRCRCRGGATGADAARCSGRANLSPRPSPEGASTCRGESSFSFWAASGVNPTAGIQDDEAQRGPGYVRLFGIFPTEPRLDVDVGWCLERPGSPSCLKKRPTPLQVYLHREPNERSPNGALPVAR